MNRIFTLIIGISFLTFIQCGPEVKFKSPQPDHRPDLNSIPTSYLGKYRSIEDSTEMVINDKMIFKIWKSNDQIQLDSIIKDLKINISSDTVIYINDGFKIDVKIADYPNKAKVSAEEKLFSLSDSGKVRSYKDFCFLNYRTKDGFWLVKILRLREGYLEFTDLISSKEIDMADEYTQVTAIKDTSNNSVQEYRLNPSRRELRRMLRHKRFEREFKKIE